MKKNKKLKNNTHALYNNNNKGKLLQQIIRKNWKK